MMSLPRVSLAFVLATAVLTNSPVGAQQSEEAELELALRLAVLLQSARAVIGAEQALINDPSVGDKGLTGEEVLARATMKFVEKTGGLPFSDGMNQREADLISAMMASISEVMDENAGSINREGVAFKGFVPAVFGRLVTETFQGKATNRAQIKVTAPMDPVRNRKSRPDKWESQIISK